MQIARWKLAMSSMVVYALAVPFSILAMGEEEARVRAYFKDAPVMANIATCESKFTQLNADGGALHGGLGGKMVGIFQIYSDIHADYAAGLGMDIYTTEGNLAYARYLYEREGTRPWNSSAGCWRDMPLEVPVTVSAEESSAAIVAQNVVNESAGLLTRSLSLGAQHEDVRTLQRILNGAGYLVADAGPGSPGNETTLFGALTREALQKFQCAREIVCTGSEESTGFGLLGPRTRIALMGETPVVTANTDVHAPLASTLFSNNEASELQRLQAQIEELTRALATLQAAPKP